MLLDMLKKFKWLDWWKINYYLFKGWVYFGRFYIFGNFNMWYVEREN